MNSAELCTRTAYKSLMPPIIRERSVHWRRYVKTWIFPTRSLARSRVRSMAFSGQHCRSTSLLVLLLLEVFKRSNERADDLWYDLLGMVKVQGTDLDMSFLTRQAADLGVTELLARALVDAGLRDA